MKIIVGLGNPGVRYGMTRHNLGFRVVDLLAKDARVGSWSTSCQALVCSAEIGGSSVTLAKPLTFMNLSGNAIRRLVAGNGVDNRDLLIVLDDLNLQLGKIRIRERGSAGGHHGMESIIGALGSDEVPRLRLGIGEENIPEDKAGFVLSDFSPAQEDTVNEMIHKAQSAVRTVVKDGIGRAMSVFNA